MKQPKIHIPAIRVNQLKAERCRRDFFVFVQEMWHTIVQEQAVYNWHIEFLCDELQQVAERLFRRDQKQYDLVINVPPGTTKSTLCSQLFEPWCWTRDPTLRFITGSYAYNLAGEQANYSMRVIRHESFQATFPSVRIDPRRGAEHNFRTTAAGQRYSTSVGGSVMGIHAHCIVVDDPLDPNRAASDAEIKKSNKWMNETLSQRKVDRALTPTILIQQRLHENDPSGHALRTRPQQIRHICLPAEVSAHIKPADLVTSYKQGLLDPVRLPRKILDEQKVVLGSFGYSGQMMQRPVPDEGGMWKENWFKIVTMEDVYGIAKRYTPGTLEWHFCSDTAYTAEETNSPTGVLAWAVCGPFLVMRQGAKFHLEQPELERTLPTWCIQQGYSRKSLILIEPKANGISTIQNLRSRTKLNYVAAKAPTKDKAARARDVAPLIEAGRVLLVDGMWVRDYLDDVTKIPFTDQWEFADCTWMALDRAQMLGINEKLPYDENFKQGRAPEAQSMRTEDVWAGMV